MDEGFDRTLTVWELVLLNGIVCGLELVASAALVYLPPMLLEAGFSENYMSWVLGLGPFLCLFIVPIIGQWMDTCTSKYGRRIPFMFALSLLVLLSLLLIPYADHMTNGTSEAGFSIHAYMLAFSVILIDFGTQAGLTPCEVFLQDVTKGLPIRDKAFGLYSLMCSLGSCGGYLILAINWENTWLGSVFGDQEYCVFSLLFFVFLCLMFINLRTASKIRTRLNIQHNKSYVNLEALNQGNRITPSSPYIPPLSSLTRVTRLCQMLMPRGIHSLFNVPYVLRRLVLSNFFAWAGLMCFLLFYTDYVGEIVYGGKPSALVGTAERIQYDEGVRMGSFGLLLHAIMSSFAAPMIEKLEDKYSKKMIHLACLVTLSLCLFSILCTNNLILINGFAMLTGVAFASMTTIPFSLVGMYHEDRELYFNDCDWSTRGLGTDMATLDTAYFCSQVLLLSFMGYLVHLTQSAVTFLVSSCLLSFVSCYFIYTAVYSKDDLPVQIKASSYTDQYNNTVIITVSKHELTENNHT